MPTRREQMIQYLEGSEYTVKDLAAMMRSNTRDTIDDLSHIKQSLGKRLKIRAAHCTGCEFTFHKRDRMNTPSRCPQCKSERVVGPWISVQRET